MSLLRSCLCRTPRLASHLAVASIRYSSTESIPITPVLSIVHHPYELPTSAIQANDPNAKFAVFEFSGTQYKVTVDDVIVADYIENVDIGQTISMDKVLYCPLLLTTALYFTLLHLLYYNMLNFPLFHFNYRYISYFYPLLYSKFRYS